MRILPLLATVVALSGCASMHSLDSDVSSYSQWPAGRKPSTYVFDRLPSQAAHAEQQEQIENAARPAVEAAGFTPAADPKTAEVKVQLGARITQTDRSPYDDPFWWGPGFHRPYAFGPGHRIFFGPYWQYGWGYDFDRYGYRREAAVLIRDAKTGEALYEAHAVNDGFTAMVETALPAMFRAAMKDFPNGAPQPHSVTVDLRR